MHICIQHQDFNLNDEYPRLKDDAPHIGAIVTFCGLVREFADSTGESLLFEHFPDMTENVLHDITQQAKQRWPIINTRIVHRIGQLDIGEQIVFVGVNSTHRAAAFNACEFIIDYLKTQAPFWKKALTTHSEYWIKAKESDQQARQRWSKY